MKHWIDFLEKRTHEAIRMGKITNSLVMSKQHKEIELKAIDEAISIYETSILNKLAPNYENNQVMILEVIKAKKKAENWNTTPTNKLKNPTSK